jgi:hypothetical protein
MLLRGLGPEKEGQHCVCSQGRSTASSHYEYTEWTEA